MQYHLETIPVWEAMEWKGECPLCALERKTEREEIERTLGASVMEPDVRVRFNERGACRNHQKMLFQGQNCLGHALIMDSHTLLKLEQLQKLQQQAHSAAKAKSSLFHKAQEPERIAAALSEMSAYCVVCDAMDTHMARYRYTVLHLWKTSTDFRAAWSASHGACLPHVEALLKTAHDVLKPTEYNAFAEEALGLLITQLTSDEKDLALFASKFDYRNQAMPWGESKTAAERAINRLRGWCVGAEPYLHEK
ncbi:MAG: DUF6062 family protein [Eubacteriales bacterium]|nr:DUF6062 family protein [Eubacteriales bacterium]